MSPKTIAVIPAHNEADQISKTLEAVWRIEGVERIILVDDGSQDATNTLARSGGAEILKTSNPGNPKGKGYALAKGLAHARSPEPEAVLIADADLGHSATHLTRLVSGLKDSSPVTIAAFPPAAGGGFGLVKSYARHGISRRTGYTPDEPLSGQRALLFSALETLPGIAPGFGAEVGMTLDLLSAGLEPREISLHLEHRSTGRTLAGFAHRARQGLDIFRAFRGTRILW